MPGINEVYRYIDEMIAEQRTALFEKRPSTRLLHMFTELKTKIHTLRDMECGEGMDHKAP